MIVSGDVSTNADAYSECDCFPLEQKIVLMQIKAGHLSTVLTYKNTFILLIKVLDHIHFQNFLLDKFSPVFCVFICNGSASGFYFRLDFSKAPIASVPS